MGAPNCTSYPPLQPNPDVSGVGVLIGFLVPPILTLLLCVAQFLLDKEPSSWIDEVVRRKARRILAGRDFELSSKSSKRWISAIAGAILIASDQQVVAGISILISGFSQLRSGISSYHWQGVVNLAWLSSVTHLITLTSLRRQARKNSPFRWWRIVAMGLMAGMLIGAIVPIGYLTTSEVDMPYSFPAWCLYHSNLNWGDSFRVLFPIYNGFYILLVLFILLGSYLRRVFTLFPSERTVSPIVLFVCKPFEASLLRLDDSNPQGFWKIGAWVIYSLIRAGYMVLISGYHLFGSTLWELTWLGFALAWGMIRVIMSREGYRNIADDTLRDVLSQEGVWGFAQVIAVVLLALPFVAFYEAYFYPSDQIKDFDFNPPPPSAITRIRDEIYHEIWYPKLLMLWYGLALAFGCDLLYVFPYLGPNSLDLLDQGFALTLRSYSIWLALDIGILWVPTVFLIDPITQELWRQTRVGQKLSHRPWISWTLLIMALIFVSVYLDVLSYSHPNL